MIVVTGGGGGLGAALARKFALLGGRVTILDIDQEASRAITKRIDDEGVLHAPEWMHLDVSDGKEFSRILEEVQAKHGRLDVMVNNAGILIAGEARDMNAELFHKITEINLMGVMYGSLAAFKIMSKQGYGKIVNISSISGLISSPLYAAYSMTKHAVVGLSKALREEGRSLGVDVLVACPSTLRTGIFDAGNVVNAPKEQIFKESLLASISAEEAASKIMDQIRLNRWITVFPTYAKIMWWLEKIHPVLLKPLHMRVIKNFRAHRAK